MDQERFARYIRPVGSVAGAIVLVLAAAGAVAAHNGVDGSASGFQAVADSAAPMQAAQSAKSTSVDALAAAQQTPDSATIGTRPGWGCGDKNHEHSGPPGNPDATNPCDKAGAPADEETGSAADEQRNNPAVAGVRRGPPAHSAAGGNKPVKPEHAANADKPGKSEQAQTKARGPNKK